MQHKSQYQQTIKTKKASSFLTRLVHKITQFSNFFTKTLYYSTI